jgi:cell wall-associated NlpC family hydrolase
VVASALAAAIGLSCLVVAPAAMADHHQGRAGDHRQRPVVPSQSEIQRAQTDAQDAADRVAEIQAELVQANQELEAAGVRAEQAFEAYNGARWEAEQATQKLKQAEADARRAEHELSGQRDRLAGLVAASYQDGGQLSALDAVLGAQGPEGVMDQLLSYEGASTSMDGQLQRFAATADLAQVFRAQAETARAEKLRLLDEAQKARDAAQAAADAAQAEADSVAARKRQLVAEMARLQGISVQLAEQRQQALEEIERRRAAAEAARQAAAEAAAAERRRRLEQQQQQQTQTPTPTPTPTEHPTPDPVETTPAPVEPAPAPVDSSPPAPAGGAAAAIAFAKAQLGDPYVWGAAGPDAWDCSGLTMGAWQAGGVSLPHYSVAQYDATTHITASQLQPGDLVFWGTTSDPSSIHHVAMYIGDGMIIHAPRTGRPVEIDSMYYWIPPNFFGRV